MKRDVRKNRAWWDRTADGYQEQHGSQLNRRRDPAWGVWSIPEDRLAILGEVQGRDILELGCGAAQWSIRLATRGARVVGLDTSGAQLAHARRLMARAGVVFPLVHASAEAVPLAGGAFDVVFCDHGGMSFADPERTVPEAARLLRPNGILAFCTATPFLFLCFDPDRDSVDDRLHADYFTMRRWEGNIVEYQRPYGEWIRLFRRNGFTVEDLIELRPPTRARTTFDLVPLSWARRWPAEHIWKVRKDGL
jgi:SAM-dependent methyltransferase